MEMAQLPPGSMIIDVELVCDDKLVSFSNLTHRRHWFLTARCTPCLTGRSEWRAEALEPRPRAVSITMIELEQRLRAPAAWSGSAAIAMYLLKASIGGCCRTFAQRSLWRFRAASRGQRAHKGSVEHAHAVLAC